MSKTKAKVIVYTLLITQIFFFISKFSNKKEIESIHQKRFLLSENETEEICSQVSDSFRNKYNAMNYEKKGYLDLSGNDEAFIELLKNKNISNMSNYLKYLLLRYSIFIVVELILIFLWICCCSCCCHPCCCCSGQKGCCVKLSYMIAILMFIGTITVGIIGLVYGHPLKENFVEAGCSGIKFYYHFQYGFGDDYNSSNEWAGLNTIYHILGDSKDIYYSIKINETIINNPSVECTTLHDDEFCDIFNKGIEIIEEVIKNYDKDIEELNGSEEQINKLEDGLNSIEKKYLDDAYEYLDNYFIKYSKFYILLFVLVIIFGVLGFLILVAYVNSCKCIKCIYFILWNIEALFMIIIFLIGVFFGLLNIFSQNIISVVEYTANQNLSYTEPIIFKEDILNYTTVCFNEDGLLSEIIKLKTSVSNTFIKLLQLKDGLKNNLVKLDDANYSSFKDGFFALFLIVNNTDKLYNNYNLNANESSFDITNVMNCTFMRNDINIFIDEVKENLIKNFKKLEIVIYFAEFFIAISIICGIIIINRYYNEEEKKSDLNNTRTEEENLKSDRKKITEKDIKNK